MIQICRIIYCILNLFNNKIKHNKIYDFYKKMNNMNGQMYLQNQLWQQLKYKGSNW